MNNLNSSGGGKIGGVPSMSSSKQGAGSGSVSPKGINSAELLTLLRQPEKKDARFRQDTFNGGLENEFSRLYVDGSKPATSASTSSASQDNWGMVGLAEMVSQALAGRLGPGPFGFDLRSTGLKLDGGEALCRSFISPWYDPSHPLGHASNLDAVLPACYNVQPSPAVTAKIPAFTDETLFYMFYAMPGDKMQEMAARELYARSWRFHKELKIWLHGMDEASLRLQAQMISPDMSAAATSPSSLSKKISSPSPFLSASMADASTPKSYTVFDPQSWTRVTRDLVLRADQLEDRFSSNAAGPAPNNGKNAPPATPILFNVNRTA